MCGDFFNLGGVLNEEEILKIKSSKPFKKLDLIIYFLVFILIFTLFLVFVIIPKRDENLGFIVKLNGKTIATVKYGQTPNIEDDFKNFVVISSDTILIYVNEEKTEYNKLQFDDEKKTVKVIETTCPSKDCEKLTLNVGNGVIICAPHNLIISPLKASGQNLPTTG